MKFKTLSPNLAVKDIRKTVAFYQETLNFNLVMAVSVSQDNVDETFAKDKEYIYAMIGRDGINLALQREDSFREDVALAKDTPLGASGTFYFDVEKLDELYESLQDKNIETTEIKTTWYGMREFYIKDNNGYILGFAEQEKS
ncbi:MAG: VOC family protein [Helicobacteraceae bacterium]|jgi:uncharacterized glyoxalase superfamily protein PhnB|nr:VOC family protein [Helicobacteraceae bacterium]